MSQMLEGVDRRTQLAGHNRLEILLFRLGHGEQKYGINVFKVQEVIHCPKLTQIPKSHPVVRGIADIRGKTIPVIDLQMSIGHPPVEDISKAFLIVTEYNRTIQGFIVDGVDKIVNMNWEEIKPPPKGVGNSCYLTAVTTVDEIFVEIIDVEKVLSEVIYQDEHIDSSIIDNMQSSEFGDKFIFIVDDSMVARNQIQRVLEDVGISYETANNGRVAYEILMGWKETAPDKINNIAMVISDVEMPEMDGYMLVTKLRDDPVLSSLYIIMHTSLSGVFNGSIVEKVGADRFISKYDPNILGATIIERLKEITEKNPGAPGVVV